jgi:membrane-anchored glycerophosphoryl diester phosphodiesterase (GDPDase)
MTSKPLGLLTIGNVVNASLRLYGSNFWRYLRLSLFAHLWLLLPIYGWARYYSEAALISRLCFGELTGQPESNTEARSQVKQKLWSFLFLAFGIGIRIFLVYMGFYALIMAIAFIAISFFASAGILSGIVIGLAIFGIFITAIVATIGLVSRWIVAELPLAVETGFNSKKSMERSWQLTKTSVGRIQGIVFVAFLVTIPVQSVTSIVPQFALISFDPASSTYWVVYGISVIFSLGGGALVMPFWQAIKAVIYFDLRNRREGLDLQLREQE